MVNCPFCGEISVSFHFTKNKYKEHLIACAHLMYKNNENCTTQEIEEFSSNNREFKEIFDEKIREIKSPSEILREIKHIEWESWIEAKYCSEFVKLINNKLKR